MLAHSTPRARSETQADPRERAHLFSPYLPNQRMIRDLIVRGRSIREGKALGMLCPDLVHITAVIKRRRQTGHILTSTQEEHEVGVIVML